MYMNFIFQTVSFLSVIGSLYMYLGELLQYYQTNTCNNLPQSAQTLDYL